MLVPPVPVVHEFPRYLILAVASSSFSTERSTNMERNNSFYCSPSAARIDGYL